MQGYYRNPKERNFNRQLCIMLSNVLVRRLEKLLFRHLKILVSGPFNHFFLILLIP